MKLLFVALLTLGTSFAQANDLRLDSCKFGKLSLDFTPNSALTALLKNEVKGSVVYKVKYMFKGKEVGASQNFAVIDELPSKTLGVVLFTFMDNEISYLDNKLSIDLKEPVSIDAPLINFKSVIEVVEGPIEGKCGLVL